MVIFLFLNILIGQFVQKLYLNKGLNAGLAGQIMVCDSDRDSQIELIFAHYDCGQNRAVVYELYPDSVLHLETIIDTMCFNAWEVGDFDNDGLFDLVVTGDFGLPALGPQIFESPDSFSYPTREVWRDTVGPLLVVPICVFDIDQDSRQEIVKVLGDYVHLVIYESVGNNLYDIIAEITTSVSNNSSSNLAFGDFDNDGQNEFAWGYTSGKFSIFECTGDNSYQETTLQQLPTGNIYDCFAVPDADSDGKWEFAFKGLRVLNGQVELFIIEATGDNTYEVIQTFYLPTGDYYGGYSDAGDIDGDGVPEIVLEARLNIFIIKAAGNDSFYVWQTLPGNATGSCVRVTNDLDNNGLNEIVISGNNQTRIYEYDPAKIEESSNSQSVIQNLKLTVSPNPFTDVANIKFQIPNLNDQTNPKPQIPNPPFPFSSPPREEGLNSAIRNPKSAISLKVYDVTGRLVKDLTQLLNYQLPNNQVIWFGDDDAGRRLPPGVYFVRLEVDKSSRGDKIIKLK